MPSDPLPIPPHLPPSVLSYRTPPPKVRKKREWPMGDLLAFLTIVYIVFSVIRIPMEASHRAMLRSEDLSDWFLAELPRRAWEAQRRAGIQAGPEPPWPRPTVPRVFVTGTLQVISGVNIAWGVAMLYIVIRHRSRPNRTNALLPPLAMTRLVISTLTLATMLLGYRRIFRVDPSMYEIAMLVIEGSVIGGAVALLSYRRDDTELEPVPLATLA